MMGRSTLCLDLPIREFSGLIMEVVELLDFLLEYLVYSYEGQMWQHSDSSEEDEIYGDINLRAMLTLIAAIISYG